MIHATRKDVLDHGYVRLVGHMVDFQDLDVVADFSPGARGAYLDAVPDDLTLDVQIARAARVSYQKGTKKASSDAALIDYLMRHRHTSPFEQVVFKFELKMPLFVAQQWIRHRTARLNQESARYSVMKNEFYVPEFNRIRGQDEVNKQGSGDLLDDEDQGRAELYIRMGSNDAFDYYQQMLDLGVARELARTVLPVGTYTSMVWQMDLHNLMHFLSLRLDEHAQWEIRQYAQAIYDLVLPLAPLAFESFENHVLNAVTFSGDEMNLIREALYMLPDDRDDIDRELQKLGLNQSRRREFIAKIGGL